MKLSLKYVFLATLVVTVSATINPSKNKKNKQKQSDTVKVRSGPQEKNVYERKLVDNEPLASDIIAESGTYYKETGLKNFNGTVLGYVTPVSSHRFFFHQRIFFLISNLSLCLMNFLVELERL